MVTNHLDLVTAIRDVQIKYFHYQMKVIGHDKGHLRPKSQIAIGSWIFSDFDYRHIVELKSKFWCTIGHHLVLFQFWPNLLHKIVILATLHLIFSQKMDVWLEIKGCSLLHTLCQAFWANKPDFLVWFKMTKGWPYVHITKLPRHKKRPVWWTSDIWPNFFLKISMPWFGKKSFRNIHMKARRL